jgi:hypothetical protein
MRRDIIGVEMMRIVLKTSAWMLQQRKIRKTGIAIAIVTADVTEAEVEVDRETDTGDQRTR